MLPSADAALSNSALKALDEGAPGAVVDVMDDDAVEMLLKAALRLQPGQQQQAWVALLSRSRVARHLDSEQRERLLLAAVNAAHISSCCKPMLELCSAWQSVHRFTVASMCAAAVQLVCLPALRHLLRMLCAQQHSGVHVAELMRWAICSNHSNRGSAADVQPVDWRFTAAWQPLQRGCTAARAEVLAALCQQHSS
jgi:hypothetical protein